MEEATGGGMKTKVYPVEVVYSLVSGRIFCTMDAMHGAMEFVLGSPIWTHQLAMHEPWEVVRSHLGSYFPSLLHFDAGEPPEGDRDDWAAGVARALGDLLGQDTLIVTQMDPPWPGMHPLEGIPEDKEVLIVEVPDDAERGR